MEKAFIIAFLCGLIIQISSAQEATIKLQPKADAPEISRHIYGQFAEHLGRSIYDGFYRYGKIRADIVKALKDVKIPNLRWPGGCFADQYHWRDGIGPKATRPQTVNTTWGMVTETNAFGTHEFLDLCQQIGCEPYFAGNVGTGTPQEMSDWLEYLNFNGKSTLTALRAKNGHPEPYKVSFWGVGNESWGCGGSMTPEYYANKYKQYASFCQNYPGAPLKLIVSGANSDDYNWTEVCMKNIDYRQMYGLSLHYYTMVKGHWPPSGSATTFEENEYASAMQSALKMEEIVTKHSAIMDKYDPKKKAALLVDEWGIWTAEEPGTPKDWLFQQNSLRDAIIAASTLNIFNNHADRVRVANLAQTVNVIHSLILTKGDEMVLTPTYHVFDFYKVHQDAKLIPLEINSPDYSYKENKMKAINASASIDKDGNTNISLVNVDATRDISISINVAGSSVNGKILTASKFNAINDFGQKPAVIPAAFNSAKLENNKLTLTIPAKSIIQLLIKK